MLVFLWLFIIPAEMLGAISSTMILVLGSKPWGFEMLGDMDLPHGRVSHSHSHSHAHAHVATRMRTDAPPRQRSVLARTNACASASLPKPVVCWHP